MFPTFISFTERHPRFATLIGLTIFILVALLWVLEFKASQNAFLPPVSPQETLEVAREATAEEKMQILESLKSDTSDDVPVEEKMKVLESLRSDTSDDVSPEEKMKILESLQ